MRAYKFLDADGCAPFTGARWTPGEWVESATVAACRAGVHAFEPRDVSWWLAATLWEVELDGGIVTARHKLVAERGRLVAEVEAYPSAVRELAEVGAWRCRDRAVEVGADALSAASTLDELAETGGSADESTWIGRAAALAADSAHFALHGLPAQSPFVSACSAAHVAASADGDQAGYESGFGAERAFQSAWLSERLNL